MKVEKQGVVKEVDDALVPDYVTAGWKLADNRTKKESVSKIDADKEDLDAKLQGK